MKTTQSYYVAQKKGKRTGSAVDKRIRSTKSKELSNTSNFINSTFEMQSFVSTHKKKQSNFSSTVGSKFDIAHLNKSSLDPGSIKNDDKLGHLLLKSETVLEKYRAKYDTLEKENKRYKRKYQEAMKKIKHLESRN